MSVRCRSDIAIGNTIRVGNDTYRFITDLEKRKYRDPYSIKPWSVEMLSADAVKEEDTAGTVDIYEMRWSIVNNTEDRCCYWPLPDSVWKDPDKYDMDKGQRIVCPRRPKYPSVF